MSFILQTLPVALAVGLALTVAFVLSRSLLHMFFEALGRLVANRQVDAAPE